jgi:peptide-methionine (R)-S-oxide reductase
MTRRNWLQVLLSLPLGSLALPRRNGWAASEKGGPAVSVQDLQKNWRSLLTEGADIATSSAPLNLSNDEWKKRLSAEAYHVLREQGTEYAGSSPLNREHRPGVFVCAGCGLPVFSSAMKFDSGTGWPSFFTTIPGAFVTLRDTKFGMVRTEHRCARCGGHHGHVFDDGPPPTGLRYCNNGLSLRFIPYVAAAAKPSK